METRSRRRGGTNRAAYKDTAREEEGEMRWRRVCICGRRVVRREGVGCGPVYPLCTWTAGEARDVGWCN
jgi:hypothetical protein